MAIKAELAELQRSLFKNSKSLHLLLSRSLKNFFRFLMAPKQRAGKEVVTSATAPPPPPTIECPIVDKGFSPFFLDFYLFWSQILAISWWIRSDSPWFGDLRESNFVTFNLTVNQKSKGFFPKLLCEASPWGYFCILFLDRMRSWASEQSWLDYLSPLNYFRHKCLLSFPAKLALEVFRTLSLCRVQS